MTSLERFEKTVAELSAGYRGLSDAIRDIGTTIDSLVAVAGESGVEVSAQEVADTVSLNITGGSLHLYPPSSGAPVNAEWAIYDSSSNSNFSRPTDPTNLTQTEAIRLAQELRRIDVAEIMTRIMTS